MKRARKGPVSFPASGTEQVGAALQLLKPVEKLFHHGLADKRLTMLWHQHLRIESSHPGHPGPAGAVAGHVAAMEAFHKADMVSEVFHRQVVRPATDRRANIAGKENAAWRIEEMEVAHRVQKVRRYRHQLAVPKRDISAFVGQEIIRALRSSPIRPPTKPEIRCGRKRLHNREVTTRARVCINQRGSDEITSGS